MAATEHLRRHADHAALEIRVLGPLQVLLDGRAVDVSGPKQHALLTLLALRGGRVVPVDALIDALWGTEELPSAPRNAIQHHVARLRHALGHDSIVAAVDGYALPGATVDALRFEDLLAAAHRAAVAHDPQRASDIVGRALELWRGTALLGLLDTSWASTEAARLEALHIDALERRFDAALALGEHAEILPALRTAVNENPLRERLWAQAMLALYRSGRQADALEAFQDARKLLDGQLGLEPGPELQRLQAEILTHDPALGTQTANERAGNLPAPGPPGVWLVRLTHAENAADVSRAVAQATGASGSTRGDGVLAHLVLLGDATAVLVLDDRGRGSDVAVARRMLGTALAHESKGAVP